LYHNYGNKEHWNALECHSLGIAEVLLLARLEMPMVMAERLAAYNQELTPE